MRLTLSEEGWFVEKTLYVDMDEVLKDFNSGINRLRGDLYMAALEAA